MRQSISVEQAQEILCSNIVLPDFDKEEETERIPIEQASGRILAEDAKAEYDQPPFPRSPLDGYAICGEDSENASRENPVSLQVVGKIYAGDVWRGELHRGEALRLMTGSPIPDGANAVIRQEDTSFAERGNTDTVQLYRTVRPWQNYCYRGEDYKAGTVLLKRGIRLNAGGIAILSSLGRTEVKVTKKPRIAVFSTGDEVMQPGAALLPGKIYDSNLHYVRARLSELGTPACIAAHLEDDAEAVAQQIRKAAETCSLIITTGGVSVGEKDILHEVRRILKSEQLFWGVRVKPGMPTLAFHYGKALVICLSGNPYGAIANLDLLVRPVLARMTGDPSLNLRTAQAVLTNSYPKPSGTRRFLRGCVNGSEVSLCLGNQTSGAIATMAGCNCFVEIPPERKGAGEGEQVTVYYL